MIVYGRNAVREALRGRRAAAVAWIMATDAAAREPWLVIDPKPFVGDRAYDATQHLLNCPTRMRADPLGTIRRFADLLEIDEARIRLWMLARTIAEPRASWTDDSLLLARALT